MVPLQQHSRGTGPKAGHCLIELVAQQEFADEEVPDIVRGDLWRNDFLGLVPSVVGQAPFVGSTNNAAAYLVNNQNQCLQVNNNL